MQLRNYVRHLSTFVKVIFLFFLAIFSLHAQDDPEVTIDEIEIVDEKLSYFSVSDGDQLSDSLNVSGFIGKLLNYSTTNHVQSNGPGLLTTLLSRGMAARHMAIVWEDYNIQSVVNGTYDLSLVPVSLFGGSRFLTESQSSLIGNASFSGAVVLENEKNNPTAEISNVYDFSGNNTLSGGWSTSFNRWKVDARFNYDSHNNEYEYFIDDEKTTQEHAYRKGLDATLNSTYFISENSGLDFSAWIQDSRREIPATKIFDHFNAVQDDENYRFNLAYKWFGEEKALKLKTAFFDENINYLSDWSDSRASTKTYITGADIFLGETHKTNIHIQYRLDRVDANFFDEVFDRSNFSMYVAQTWDITSAFNICGIFRNEIIDGSFEPLTYDFKLNYKLSDPVRAAAYFGKYHTLPNFNDLYWPFGGNKDLMEESSIQTGLKLFYEKRSDGSFIKVDLGGFYNNIDNWIQWSPDELGVWSPTNQKKVETYGLETSIDIGTSIGQNQGLLFHLHTGLTETNIKEDINPALVGKELLYVPNFKWGGSFRYFYDDFAIASYYGYTGERFDTPDNLIALEAFGILDLKTSYGFQISDDVRCTLHFGINNLLNKDYEIIGTYPYPLRTFEVGAKLEL